MRLGLRWPKQADYQFVAEGWSIGQKLEWRGPSKGAFRPDSAIIRVILDDEDARKHQVLAVLRIENRKACLITAIDMTANKQPYELAQQAADEKAASFVCGKSEAAATGEPTPWTKQVLE